MKSPHPVAMFLVGMLGFSLGLWLCYPLTYVAVKLDIRTESAARSVAVAGMSLLWLNRRIGKPILRRFGFRLPTLFVLLTVVCVVKAWVNYSLNWIEKRQSLIDHQKVIVGARFVERWRAPGYLWLFGEEGYELIYLHGSDEEQDRAVKLFPEAIRHRTTIAYPPSAQD